MELPIPSHNDRQMTAPASRVDGGGVGNILHIPGRVGMMPSGRRRVGMATAMAADDT